MRTLPLGNSFVTSKNLAAKLYNAKDRRDLPKQIQTFMVLPVAEPQKFGSPEGAPFGWPREPFNFPTLFLGPSSKNRERSPIGVPYPRKLETISRKISIEKLARKKIK
ncbi:MAG: hypothetical protein A2712_05130 [Deltaproteobacteria bacterium RIFCSPHIGHO2_01_FULL_43_49]|nr:MAG: hypothetical protein A2712_05130 [Deltaproteobacteria bacterium RIFCSPHIGHO2_01_FULL_43_49]